MSKNFHRTNDDDDKIVVSKNGKDYTDDAIRALTEFQERYFDSVIIRKLFKGGKIILILPLFM